MKEKHPKLPRVLEEGEKAIKPNDMTSKDIIDCAMNTKDELCLKVVRKFIEILAVETGNFALKTLPYGGIYITGGVVNGIWDYLTTDDLFQETFYFKGRFD